MSDRQTQRAAPFERKAFLASEIKRIKIETKRGELITRWELEQDHASLFKKAAHDLDTLPDIVERDCGAPGSLIMAIEKEIFAFREEVYLALVSGDDAPTVVDAP